MRRPRAHGDLGGVHLVCITRSLGRALYGSGGSRVPFLSALLLAQVKVAGLKLKSVQGVLRAPAEGEGCVAPRVETANDTCRAVRRA